MTGRALPAQYRSMCTLVPDHSQPPDYRFTVVTVPYPIHSAELVRTATGAYIVRTLSVPLQRVLPPRPWGEAVWAASAWAGRLYGQEWRTRFSGQQRTMIGQQGCPYHGPDGLCGASIEVGTIWCAKHPWGRKAT